MEEIELLVLTGLGLIILFGAIGEVIFRRTKISNILILLIIGFIIGPLTGLLSIEVLNNIKPIIGPLALILILFDGGMQMKIGELFTKSAKSSLLIIIVFLFSVSSIALISHFVLNISFLDAVLLGVILGGTSSNITIPITKNLIIDPTTKSYLFLESAFTDVLCIVIAISLLSSSISGSFDVRHFGETIFAKFSIGAIIGLLAGIAWLGFVNRIKLSYEYMVTFALLLLLYSFSQFFGGSGAITVLTFGIILGNGKEISRLMKQEYRNSIDRFREFQDEMSFLISTFFFVYLGAITNTTNLFYTFLGAGLVLFALIIRYLVFRFAGNMFGIKDKTIASVLYSRGLSAAVLAFLPVLYNPNNSFYNLIPDIVIGGIVGSILFSTLGIYLGYNEKKEKEEIEEQKEESVDEIAENLKVD